MIHNNEKKPDVAPIWRRLAALGYDLFVLTAISFGYSAVVTAIAALRNPTAAHDYQPMFNNWLFPTGWILCLALFYCWFWRKSGQTIGMKTWKIQLVPQNNELAQVSWLQCIIRCTTAPPAILLFGIGYWSALFHKQRLTLQDRLSKTKVVLIKRT